MGPESNSTVSTPSRTLKNRVLRETASPMTSRQAASVRASSSRAPCPLRRSHSDMASPRETASAFRDVRRRPSARLVYACHGAWFRDSCGITPSDPTHHALKRHISRFEQVRNAVRVGVRNKHLTERALPNTAINAPARCASILSKMSSRSRMGLRPTRCARCSTCASLKANKKVFCWP